MASTDIIIGLVSGLYALVVPLYYRVGKLEQRLKDTIGIICDGGLYECEDIGYTKRGYTPKRK